MSGKKMKGNRKKNETRKRVEGSSTPAMRTTPQLTQSH
jgi:hypothetical protein